MVHRPYVNRGTFSGRHQVKVKRDIHESTTPPRPQRDRLPFRPRSHTYTESDNMLSSSRGRSTRRRRETFTRLRREDQRDRLRRRDGYTSHHCRTQTRQIEVHALVFERRANPNTKISWTKKTHSVDSHH